MICDTMGYRQITDWSSTEQFHMPFFTGHLAKFPHRYGGESYAHKAGPLENLLVRSEASELCSNNRRWLCVERWCAPDEK